MVERLSKKLLVQIEDLKTKGNSVKQIAKKLKITPTDVQNGINKIYEQEIRNGEY